jgi:hypothetical protein
LLPTGPSLRSNWPCHSSTGKPQSSRRDATCVCVCVCVCVCRGRSAVG